GDLLAIGSLTGSLEGEAAVSGDLFGSGNLVGLVAGQGDLSGTLSGGSAGSISGFIFSTAICFGTLSGSSPTPPPPPPPPPYPPRYGSSNINSSQGSYAGTTVATAFPQSGNQKLDLIQIIGPGGKKVWKVDYLGNAVMNPDSWTDQGTILGQFFGSDVSGALGLRTGQDVFSIYNNGRCIWRVDWKGNSHFGN